MAVAVDAKTQALRRQRRLLAIVIVATLTLMTLLMFARVRSTEVELELIATEFELAVSERQVITSGLPVASLGIVGVGRIDAPDDDEGRPLFPAGRIDAVGAIRLMPAEATNDSPATNVTLGEIVVPAGTRIRLAVAEPTATYRVDFYGKPVSVPVSVHGRVRASSSESPPKESSFSAPRLVTITAAGDELALDLGLHRAVKRNGFVPVIDVSDLAASRIDQHVDPAGSVVRRVSTIVSGSVFLTAVEDREHKLRTGEVLVLNGVHGEVASLAFTDTGIALNFRGRVRDVTVGWGEHPRSLMPTWLEWLRARHGLTLVWGSAIYLLGVMATVARLWGVKV